MSEIVVRDSELDGRRLTSRLSAPRGLRKYFGSFEMFVNYDVDIYANRSILNIPLLAVVLPLAGLTGSDIHVDELDRTFKESMDELQEEFKKMYPEAPFTTSIEADTLVDNRIDDDTFERTALLFSGGIDSTYSLITNLHLKPKLIMHWGVEWHPYPKYSEYWERVISTYSEFARRQGLTFHHTETNARQILDDRRIEHDFHRMLNDGTFWRLQHSLALIPLIAPLSIGRFNNVLFSASHTPELDEKYPWGSMPSTDEKIVWADAKVKCEGYIHRFDKIKAIKEYLKNERLMLRLCNTPRLAGKKLNCGTCGFCLDAIMPLVQAGIDPNQCGFELDDSTFQLIRNYMEKDTFSDLYISFYFEPLQKNIPDNIEHNLYGSKEFFEWFRTLDLKSKIKDVWMYRDIYNCLPFTVAKVLDKFYQKIGINIHEHAPVRPHTPERKLS